MFGSLARKMAIRLGIRQHLFPLYDLVNSQRAAKLAKLYDPNNSVKGINTQKRDYCITVSLTTFPKRIESAKYVVDSMLKQTLKPDRVMLVLAFEEFGSKIELPNDYMQLEKRGLSIVFSENLKPHKKYQYAMKHFPDDVIITVDDDAFYPYDLVETLFDSYQKYPTAISAMRVHRILFNNKSLLPYNDWEFKAKHADKPAHDLISTGLGGVLYPPRCMEPQLDILFDSDAIRKTCLEADDLWLKINSLLCNVPTVAAKQNVLKLLLVPSTQNTSLHKANVDKGENDKALRRIMKHLGISDEELHNRIYGIDLGGKLKID